MFCFALEEKLLPLLLGSFEEPHLFCVLMLKDNPIYTTC